MTQDVCFSLGVEFMASYANSPSVSMGSHKIRGQILAIY